MLYLHFKISTELCQFFLRIVVFIAIICSFSANGQTVSDLVLNEVANNFMAENFPGGARKIQSVIPFTYDNLNSLNLFELEPEGWILLSADIKVEPVIGFSFTGKFKIPDENINDPMYNWLNFYQRQIKEIITDESLKEQSWMETDQESDSFKGSARQFCQSNTFYDS